jgi:hypothetical protein
VLCARKLPLHKSLFLDQNLHCIDLIIPHNFHLIIPHNFMGGGGGGGCKEVVAVAVAVASVVLVVQKGLHRHHLVGLQQ